MIKFKDIEELQWPLEVWKAVEGDRAELIDLLRSGRKLSRRSRNALADWLEGKLQPVKLPRGRWRTESKVGLAWMHYDMMRAYIRKKGWHRKQAGRLYWSTDRLLESVARREGVDVEALGIFARRAKPSRQASLAELVATYRQQTSIQQAREGIAREIRSRK